MKKAILLVALLVASVLKPMGAGAQSDFFFNVYGGSTNLWSSTFLQLPPALINAMIADEDGNGYGTLRYEVLSMKNDGNKVKLNKGNYFGFKAKDLFANFQYGARFGWQPELSPFGIYVSCAYQHRQFDARFDSSIDEWSCFRLNYVRPGVGIRITPLVGMLRSEGWSPILEVGTAYNYNFSCKAPYENTKDQFNDGITTNLALGVRFEGASITAGAEIDNYSLLNKNFTPDNGITFPYKNIKTNHVTIYLSISQDF